MANNNPSANIPKGYWPPKNKGHKTPTIFLDRALDIDITSHRLSESFEKVDFSNLDSKTGRVVLNTIGFGDKVKSMPSEFPMPRSGRLEIGLSSDTHFTNFHKHCKKGVHCRLRGYTVFFEA
jgi:hypothetical protein